MRLAGQVLHALTVATLAELGLIMKFFILFFDIQRTIFLNRHIIADVIIPPPHPKNTVYGLV